MQVFLCLMRMRTHQGFKREAAVGRNIKFYDFFVLLVAKNFLFAYSYMYVVIRGMEQDAYRIIQFFR